MQHAEPVPPFDLRIAALILGAVFAVYLPSLFNGFVWDDDRFLTENPLIHAADGLRMFWLSRKAPDYFPLTSTTLWIEWRVWGLHAAGYHAVNILLHACSSIMLWRTFARLRHPAALPVALLFALHPVAAETVAWITERKNTLCMFFAAGSTLLFLRSEDDDSVRDRILSLGAFILALLAKTAVVTLPVALLLLRWYRSGRIVRRDIVAVAPFFLASLVLGLVTVWFQYSVNIAGDVVRTDPMWRRLQIAGWAVWFYLAKAVLPVGLCFVYPPPSLHSGIAGWIPSAALVACGIGVARLKGPLRTPLAVALGSLVALLLPVLGLLDIYFMRYALVSDHWAYFALPASCAVAAWAIVQLARRFRVPANAAVAVVIVGFAVLTVREQPQYRDAETLWRSTVERNPRAWIAYSNLGVIEESRGEPAEAMRLYEAAIEAFPDYREAHFNLANVLRDMDRPAEALRHYDEALRIDPNHAASLNNSANVLLAQGSVAEAVDRLRVAVQQHPDDSGLASNLGAALLAGGSEEEAVVAFESALALDPGDISALVNLGGHCAAKGDFDRAESLLSHAVAIDPRNVEALFNLASVLHLRGNLDAAVMRYREAAELAPDRPLIRKYLEEALAEAARKGTPH